MGSQANLWSLFGARWGWPSPTMTISQDLDDLVRHEREMESQRSYNYCILDNGDTQLLGCVYIDPPNTASPLDVDAEICWWIVDSAMGTELETCVKSAIPQWIHQTVAFPESSGRLVVARAPMNRFQSDAPLPSSFAKASSPRNEKTGLREGSDRSRDTVEHRRLMVTVQNQPPGPH